MVTTRITRSQTLGTKLKSTATTIVDTTTVLKEKNANKVKKMKVVKVKASKEVKESKVDLSELPVQNQFSDKNATPIDEGHPVIAAIIKKDP
jgi:3-polyprenyl-4-hydroxybenzoate decarboxylase